jgi:Uma2 family endonuclease
MIATKENFPTFTPEAYFAWEAQQLEKHELFDGQVYAMSGGSVNHSRIAVKLTSLIDTHLANGDCITGNSDLRVNILGTSNYTYPDASVTCDDRDKTTTQYISYPCLIVEVLSDRTESYDRGNKFRLYRQNPALIDYLLVSSTSVEIDLYHKNENGDWLILNYQSGDTIDLKSINFSFPIEQLYRNLTLTPETPPLN